MQFVTRYSSLVQRNKDCCRMHNLTFEERACSDAVGHMQMLLNISCLFPAFPYWVLYNLWFNVDLCLRTRILWMVCKKVLLNPVDNLSVYFNNFTIIVISLYVFTAEYRAPRISSFEDTHCAPFLNESFFYEKYIRKSVMGIRIFPCPFKMTWVIVRLPELRTNQKIFFYSHEFKGQISNNK